MLEVSSQFFGCFAASQNRPLCGICSSYGLDVCKNFEVVYGTLRRTGMPKVNPFTKERSREGPAKNKLVTCYK